MAGRLVLWDEILLSTGYAVIVGPSIDDGLFLAPVPVAAAAFRVSAIPGSWRAKDCLRPLGP